MRGSAALQAAYELNANLTNFCPLWTRRLSSLVRSGLESLLVQSNKALLQEAGDAVAVASPLPGGDACDGLGDRVEAVENSSRRFCSIFRFSYFR